MFSNGLITTVLLSELHLYVEVDDIDIKDVNSFPVRGSIHKDIYGVHHILKSGFRSKSNGRIYSPTRRFSCACTAARRTHHIAPTVISTCLIVTTPLCSFGGAQESP